jgi:hypothetical protein
MKILTQILIIYFLLHSVSFSSEDENESKVRFPVWYNPSDATDIYGVSLGLWMPEKQSQNIKGISINFGRNIDSFNGSHARNQVFGISFEVISNVCITKGIQFAFFNQNHFFNQHMVSNLNCFEHGLPMPPTFSHLYGMQIGLYNNIDFGNGVQISLYNSAEDLMQGVQLGFVNISANVEGIQIGISNNLIFSRSFLEYNKYRSFQIGLFNYSEKLNGIQIGLINWTDKNWMPIINWDFD